MVSIAAEREVTGVVIASNVAGDDYLPSLFSAQSLRAHPLLALLSC